VTPERAADVAEQIVCALEDYFPHWHSQVDHGPQWEDIQDARAGLVRVLAEVLAGERT
jgi:hypothetical protein